LQYVSMRDWTDAEVQQYLKNGGVFHEETGVFSNDADMQWGGGAHKKITRQALIILSNDHYGGGTTPFDGYVAWGTKYDYIKEVIIDGSYYADYSPAEIGLPMFGGHFYGADGTNYTGSSSRTAYHNFNNHFYDAVNHYNAGNKYFAYEKLGYAIHYVCDLNAPHHAANVQVKPEDPKSMHGPYESWVDGVIDQMLIERILPAENDPYTYVIRNDVSTLDMANSWSAAARKNIDDCNKYTYSPRLGYQFDSSTAYAKTEEMVHRSQRAAAAILYRFLLLTGQY